METRAFLAFTRQAAVLLSRRASLVALGAFALAGLADAKKKKTCKPCRKKNKGKCRGKKPDGAACGSGNVCQNGRCVSPTCVPPCVAPQFCGDGTCACPSGSIPCGEACLEEGQCCVDADCEFQRICVDGRCVCQGCL